MKTYVITKIVPNYCTNCHDNDDTSISFVSNSDKNLIQFVETLDVDIITHQQYALYVYENEIETHLNYISKSFKENIKDFIKNIK